MNFLKLSKRRSFVSEFIYTVLNIALAVGILVVVLSIESPLPAIGLFLLSKWRMIAVRPRYWFANVQANLIDIIVGLSYVILLNAASSTLAVQIILAALYVVWLLFVKPRSKRAFITTQAGVAVFLGVTSLMAVSYSWYVSIVVFGMWLIGYSAARHVLGHYDEAHRSFFSLLWGYVFAELGWLTYHWTFAYVIPGSGGLKLSQAAIIATALSFLTERVYASYHRHEGVRAGDIILPILLTVGVILVMMMFFNTLDRRAV